MEFISRTIAPAGRNKYGNYMSSGNITKTVISTTYDGNGTTTTIADNPEEEIEDTVSFYCILSKNSVTFDAMNLIHGTSESTTAVAYRGYDKAPTYICDMGAVSATTNEEDIITDIAAPENMGIVGIPSGITIQLVNNGTSATTIVVGADNTLTGTSGTISFPVCVYKRSDAIPQPDDLLDWYDSGEYCEQVWLDYVWNVNRNDASTYILELSNQMAGVNCDSNGNIYSASTATLTCSAWTYQGVTLIPATYELFIHPMYNAHGVYITSDGVLHWSSNFGFDGSNLPIDVIATLSGSPIATKTMNISKNYPGADGTPATMRWIETSHNIAKYDPNSDTFSPTAVTGTVYKQVGDGEPEMDMGVSIYQWYNDIETGKTSAAGTITAGVYQGVSAITFALQNSDNIYYEKEEVPVLSEGTNGQPGQQGPPGPKGDIGESAWYLSLSNDNASVNCDASGNVLSNAIRPSSTAILRRGSVSASGATYSIEVHDGLSAITPSSYDISMSGNTVTCGPNFHFSASPLEIRVSGYDSSGTLRDVKIMSISKSLAGEDGSDAISYFLVPDFGSILFDRTTSAATPSTVTASAYKQIGGSAVMPAQDVIITYALIDRNGDEPYGDESGNSVTVNAETAATYCKIRFRLYSLNYQEMLDFEDVDIIMEGSSSVQGRTGAAIRGPYDYNEYTQTTRVWCNGQPSMVYPQSEKWIDVIIKDGVYYYCSTTYNGPLEPWAIVGANWTSGDTFDFIATNLIMASGASINFITGNELYLRNSANTITAGAAGGDGVNFWAGGQSPASAAFTVDASGSVVATKGKIGGWSLTDGAGLLWYEQDENGNFVFSQLNKNRISVEENWEGNDSTFDASCDYGIYYSTTNYGRTGLRIDGAGVKFEDNMGNRSKFYCELPIYGDQTLKINTPVIVSGDVISYTMSGITSDSVGYLTKDCYVSSPWFGMKMAVITTGSSYSDYFTDMNGSWYFNDVNLNIDTTYYRYMRQATSANVRSDWSTTGLGVPEEWVGMWCAMWYNNNNPKYIPTGIYGPSFNNRKGDTLYFEV